MVRSLVCMGILALSLLAAVAQPEILDHGLLSLTLTDPDGKPAVGLPLIVTVGDFRQDFTLDARGALQCMLPAGDLQLQMPGVPATKATLAPNGVVKLALSMAGPPCMLAISYGDGTPVSGRILGWYRSPTGTDRHFRPVGIAPTRVWFPQVPPTVTDFGIMVNQNGLALNPTFRKVWKAEELQDLRALSVTLPRPVRVVLTFTDAGGAPLRNTAVTLQVSYLGFTYVHSGPESKTTYRNTLKAVTGIDGTADFGRWPAQDYQVTATVDGRATPQTTILVKDDGTVTPAQLTLAP